MHQPIKKRRSDKIMVANILKELDIAFNKVQSSGNPVDKEKRLELLNYIERFIREYTWTKSPNIDEFLLYGKLPTRDYASITGRTEDNVRSIASKLGKKIRSIIGEDAVEIAVSGSEEEMSKLIKHLNLLRKKITAIEIIPTEILTKVSDSRCSVIYHMSDIEAELNFLRLHTKKAITDGIKELSKDKISFIFKVLNAQSGELLKYKQQIISELDNK